jgi:hypothetical protein
MIDAHINVPVIVSNIKYSIGYCFAVYLVRKVVHVDLRRCAFRLPSRPVILVVTHELLLFGINGDDRYTSFQKPLCLSVDMTKLRVTIRIIAPFSFLVV